MKDFWNNIVHISSDNKYAKLAIRYSQLFATSIYFFIFMYYLNGDRLGNQVWPVLLYGLTLDVGLKYFIDKKVGFEISGLIAALATVLLMRANMILWPYFVSVTVAIVSKFIFRDEHGHYFNPAAIGLLFVSLCFSDVCQVQIGQWIVNQRLYLLMFLIGITISKINNKLTLSSTYFFTLISLRLAWALFYDLNLFFFLGFSSSASTLIFSYHMITDPKTSPVSAKGQFVFGFSIAILTFLLQTFEYPFATFMALCVVSAIVNPFRDKYELFRSKEV